MPHEPSAMVVHLGAVHRKIFQSPTMLHFFFFDLPCQLPCFGACTCTHLNPSPPLSCRPNS